jgi:hypothetical protein
MPRRGEDSVPGFDIDRGVEGSNVVKEEISKAVIGSWTVSD